MRKNTVDRQEKLFAYILIVLALIAFFVLNCLTPVQRDDWSYSFNFATKTRIASFADIFQSLGVNYARVNGRLPVHFLAHLYLWVGKDVFNCVNTIAFGGLITLIYFHAFGTFRGFRPYAWLVAFAGLWALTPAFGESFLWVTGAANYLYGMLMILLYLVPYRCSLGLEHPADKLWHIPVALVFGVLAGWTNENTGGALAVMLFCLTIWRLIEKKRVPLWWWAGLIGVTVGVAIMVLAPGELSRLNGAGGMGGLYGIIRRAVSITKRLLQVFWPGIIAWVLLLVYYLHTKKEKKRLCLPCVVLLTGCAATYSMAISPWMPDRTWSGPLIFFLISAIALWYESGEPGVRKKYLRLLLTSTCAVLLIVHFAIAVPRLISTKNAFEVREKEASEQLLQGKRDLFLDSVCGSGSRFDAAEVGGDISSDPGYWLNVELARYYGVVSVVAKER